MLMVFADSVAVPDVDEAVSHLGKVIEYLKLPLVALSEKLKDEGANGPPCGPEATRPVSGTTSSS
jgi:hypothetical protein